MIQVDHYGLHWDGAVAWLIQGRGTSNFAGLKARSPFQLSAGMCNHLIPAAAPIPDRIHWEKFLGIIKDPLVDITLPIPRERGRNTFFVEDAFNDLSFYLSTLSRMSSPIKPIVRPMWGTKVKDLEKEMMTTNVQPLILAQAETKHQELVDTIVDMSMYSPRTTIVVGSPDIVVQAPMQRVKTCIRKHDLQEIIALPLENIGAAVLRRFARKEQIDAPMESRQDRRERQIKERNRT